MNFLHPNGINLNILFYFFFRPAHKVSSNLWTPPSCRLSRIKDVIDPSSSSSPLTSSSSSSSPSCEVATLMPAIQLEAPCPPPKLFYYDSKRSGQRQYGLFYEPIVATPGEKCPTVLFVYGGPQVRLLVSQLHAQYCLH